MTGASIVSVATVAPVTALLMALAVGVSVTRWARAILSDRSRYLNLVGRLPAHPLVARMVGPLTTRRVRRLGIPVIGRLAGPLGSLSTRWCRTPMAAVAWRHGNAALHTLRRHAPTPRHRRRATMSVLVLAATAQLLGGPRQASRTTSSRP